MLLFFVVSVLSGENEGQCIPCKGSQFSKIDACHETGYIHIKNEKYEACKPTDSLGYLLAIKLFVVFGALAAGLIFLANMRRNYLLGSRFS